MLVRKNNYEWMTVTSVNKRGLLLVCRGVLLADFVADVLESPTLSSQPSLFFFDGEIKSPLKLSCFLPLFGQLLLQNLTLFLEKIFFSHSEDDIFFD